MPLRTCDTAGGCSWRRLSLPKRRQSPPPPISTPHSASVHAGTKQVSADVTWLFCFFLLSRAATRNHPSGFAAPLVVFSISTSRSPRRNELNYMKQAGGFISAGGVIAQGFHDTTDRSPCPGRRLRRGAAERGGGGDVRAPFGFRLRNAPGFTGTCLVRSNPTNSPSDAGGR